MSSGDYWDRRRSALEALTDSRCRVTASRIARLYDNALERILQRIGKLFDRFQRGYRLTPGEATELLTAEQTREARQELLELFERCGDAGLREELRAKLDAPAYAYRISRLEALRDQVYFDARSVGLEEIRYQEARLADVYEQSYYRTAFDLSQEAEENVPFQTLDDPRVEEAVREYWSTSPGELGKNFSDRVWENTTELAEQVREVVTEGLVNGGNYREMAQELEARMGTVRAEKKLQPDGSVRTTLTGSGAKYRAARLIRTEGNHISGQATIKAFQDAGIQRYLYRALLEVRTCKICGGLDGKDFPVSEQRTGVNMHPMHPNCRCFIAPYHDKDWLSRYTRSAQTGEKHWEPVPQSMTYAEWYAKYVKPGTGLKAQEQAIRNRSADREQLSRYRRVLGSDAPESLEEFRRLKYTDSERWEGLRREYRTLSEIERKAWTSDFKNRASTVYRSFRNDGIEMSAHAVARYLDRQTDKRGNRIFDYDTIRDFCRRPVNYMQDDGREIRFYDRISITSNPETGEVITIVCRSRPKSEWRSINGSESD